MGLEPIIPTWREGMLPLHHIRNKPTILHRVGTDVVEIGMFTVLSKLDQHAPKLA